jgi:hypothetical protein
VNSDARTPAERVGPGLWSIPVPIPSEAAAHLRYLERRQLVTVLRPEGTARYELSVDRRRRTPGRPA